MIFIAAILFSVFADEFVRSNFALHHNALFDKIFSFGHWYGTGKPTLYLFCLMYLGGMIFNFEKLRRTGFLIAETFIFAGLITVAVKSVIGRWRPFNGDGCLVFTPFIAGPNSHLSMPSGHVAAAFALSMALSNLYSNYFWKVFCILLAFVTALSRIYHDQHWLSDVVAAAFISVTVALQLIRNAEKAESGEFLYAD